MCLPRDVTLTDSSAYKILLKGLASQSGRCLNIKMKTWLKFLE